MKYLYAAFLLLLSALGASAQRLTLASHTPLMAASFQAKAVLYFDCWKGRTSVVYWNGEADVTDPIPSCEASAQLGALNANDVFDALWIGGKFCIATNGSGAGWSGDTGGSILQRGTGYSQINETSHYYPTNANQIAHCYNGATDYGPIAANQGALIGSVCTDASVAGSVSFVYGSAAPGGGAARFCVWSVDDEPIRSTVTDNENNWTFAGTTSVDIENSDQGVNGGIGNRVTFLSGLARRSPGLSFSQSIGSSLQYQPAYCGIGFSLDNQGNHSPDRLGELLSPNGYVAADGVDWNMVTTGLHYYPPMLGMHYVQAQETTDGTARCWFRTVSGQRYGLTFDFQM